MLARVDTSPFRLPKYLAEALVQGLLSRKLEERHSVEWKTQKVSGGYLF